MVDRFDHDPRLRRSTTVLVYGAYAVQLTARPTIRLPIPQPVDRVLKAC